MSVPTVAVTGVPDPLPDGLARTVAWWRAQQDQAA